MVRTDLGGGSLQSRLLGLVLRNTAKRVIFAWSVAPRLPWPYALVDLLGRVQRPLAGTTVEDLALPGCRALVHRAPVSDPGRVIVYFHGGAFVVGGRHLHRELISRIAHSTGATVVAMEYRKLPRHPIATSVEDGLDGYRHALGLGVPPEDIVFMGDSAGGFLCFTVADAARQAGLPLPAAIVAMSPLVDLDLARTPVSDARRGCDLFGPRAIPAFSRLAFRRAGQPGLHAPADCDLTVMPPTLLQVSSAESLYPQVCALADQLDAAGVPVRLQVWDRQVHVFQAARFLPEARQAVAEVGRFVRHALAGRRDEESATA